MKRARKVAKTLPIADGPPHLEQRILILAPTGNDAPLTADFLTKAGLTPQICGDVAELCAHAIEGCGAILLAEETLGAASMSLLVDALARQPEWSDIPVTIIASGGEASQMQLRRLGVFGPGGNVTLLERPFRPGTLTSTLEAALRSRRRQYEVRKLVQTMSSLMREQESQARLFDVTLSSIADLAYTFDLEGNWIYANKPLLKIWGKTLPEITGKSSLELGYPPELARRLKRQVKEVIATRKPVKGETYFTDAAGKEDYHEYIFSPVLADDGTVTAVCGTTRLTTERKQAEAILRQNEALFSALVDLAPTGMYVVDGQFRLQQINARALPAFVKVEPRTGRDFGEVMEILWGPEIGAQLAGIFRHTLTTGEAYRSPRFAEHRQDLNEDKAYEWETQRVTLPDGTHGVVCFFNDITETERNKANLAFLATIGNDLLRLDTVDDILNTVCEKICGYLRLSSGCFVEINEDANIVTATHEWRRPGMPVLIGTYKLSDYLSADFQKDLRAGEFFIVRDTDTDPRTDAEKYAQLKIRSFVCVPLITDGRWKFMFDIYDSKPREWRVDEVGLVRELTARIWARLERVRADVVLRQNEALFAALIEEAPVGVYVINAEFRVQQINTRALPAFEKVEPKTGRTLTEVMHIQWGREAGDELAAIFRHTLDTGEAYVSPGYSNVRADLGVEKTYEWQTRRVTLPNGSHGVVCYFNDITERIRSEQALIQAKIAAESASRAKDNFLAALSHELRTPLNPALLIASESADNHELPGEVRSNFETIRKNIELEARLIDDLLDLTRITAGKMILNQDMVNVHYILADALRTVQTDQQEKNIPVTIKLDATHSLIDGDPVRLQQIFWNVLKNAVKFTPANGQITVETGNGADGQIIIKITDNGLGMSEAEVARIFAPFAQGDHARGNTHQFGGLGLGLAIAKNLVELHGGKISARSAGVGLGSVFTIELPTAQKANARERIERDSKPKASNVSEHGANPISVLLVEDHEITRTVLAQLLTRRNYKVTPADSIASARELAGRHKFDLLISDIGLPDGNGNDLMKEFKEHYGLKGIALTGYGMEEDIARGKAAGFVTHLIKPVTIQSLETALAMMKSKA
ncbi:MAG TPA: PAS domain-containing protein [Candidatus Sulfotelmatobacter sp.]|nr:PAS domain-containing protein [Candidatus Sulfotelmatobacter sp.]